jgi:two-component sensor histidine kinase
MSLIFSSDFFLGTRSTQRNISSHLLGIVVTALVSMALIAIGLITYTNSEQREFAEAEMSVTARALSVALDQQLLVTRAALESIGAAVTEGGDPEQLRRIARTVQAMHPNWSTVSLRDAAGATLFSTAVPYGTPAPELADISTQIAEVIGSGHPQVTDLMYDPVSKTPVAAVLVPVQGRGGRRFALVAEVAASKWEELLRNQQIPPGWVAGIVDRTGIVIARTRASEQYVGQPVRDWMKEAIQSAPEGRSEGLALEGELQTLAFSRSAVSGWTVTFAAPAAFFQEPLRRSLWTSVAICGLALGAASLLVLHYARRLSRSVVGLTRMAEAMQTPGATLPPPPPADMEELTSVYDSMRQATDQLRKADEQRMTSMRELQHRVKNDLQAIMALLALEGRQSKSDETQRILKELEGRIEALRLVHSRLYEAKLIGRIELGGYLRELCGNSVALYGRGHAGGIGFEATVGEVHVGHDTAVSLGLIANEFITNSAKHAFPGRAGTISLDLAVPKPGEVRLRLSDDGVGLSPNRTRSSGMRLISMLAGQVGAKPEWDTEAGTSLRLSFHVEEEPAAA